SFSTSARKAAPGRRSRAASSRPTLFPSPTSSTPGTVNGAPRPHIGPQRRGARPRPDEDRPMPEPTPSPPASHPNLPFRIPALQMDFIGRDALIAAMNAWVLDKAKSLGGILQDQGALAEDERAALETLVDKHLRKHGGDAERSLASLGPAGAVG